jgi:hypothetical protein
MYGVPTDLDLRPFQGATLVQIAIGDFQLQFHFDSDARIAVEGGWQLLGPSGEIIECASRGESNSDRNDSEVLVLLGRAVEGGSVHSPEYFELRFERGLVLRVFDDSDRYESFSIQPGDILCDGSICSFPAIV